MPVYIQWKWQKQTETLLAVFHFYDDYSKPNLRLLKWNRDMPTGLYLPKKDIKHDLSLSPLKKSWISWSPSHLEMALLMQLLTYANIINGLKPSEKKKLWFELTGRDEMLTRFSEKNASRFLTPRTISKRIGKDTKVIIYGGTKEEDYPLYHCVELCSEYIDYVWKKLKPYV